MSANQQMLLASGEVPIPSSYLATGHKEAPFISVFPKYENSLGERFLNPATLPPSYGYSVAFSPAVTEIAVAHNGSPYITAYPWSSGGFGTKFANPTTLPGTIGYAVQFSPSGTEIAVAHSSAPYITAYPWSSGGFGTKFANPTTLPGAAGRSIAFSPAGTDIYVGASYPYWTHYGWSSLGFGAKITHTHVLSSNLKGIAFSADANMIAICAGSSYSLKIFKTNKYAVMEEISSPSYWTNENYGVAFSNSISPIKMPEQPTCFILVGSNVYEWSASGVGLQSASIVGALKLSPSASVLVALVNGNLRFYTQPSPGIFVLHPSSSSIPGAINDIDISPSGDAVAVAHRDSLLLSVYPLTLNNGIGIRFNDPVPPIGSRTDDPQPAGERVKFSPSGTEIVIIPRNGYPRVQAYKWSLSGFGDVIDVTTIYGTDIGFSPAGTEVLIMGSGGGDPPYVAAYPWSQSGLGTKFSDPITLPDGDSISCAFSPAGTEVAIVTKTVYDVIGSFISVYRWSPGGFGTKFDNPDSLPWVSGIHGVDVQFSPGGTEIIFTCNEAPYILAYEWKPDGFGERISMPAVISQSNSAFSFSPLI